MFNPPCPDLIGIKRSLRHDSYLEAIAKAVSR